MRTALAIGTIVIRLITVLSVLHGNHDDIDPHF
ncbi:hypothetical protein Ga0074812_110127 [Parafrankia irregularis]|uniref:Uncharacterized protein n=1 Tax=Parafrankia irregularis TaxID=795642 RepID=A0A0S4QQA2_9ACTN|nr:hypothetical protein Ga0074812_110127 [Parafrankia irregularis]